MDLEIGDISADTPSLFNKIPASLHSTSDSLRTMLQNSVANRDSTLSPKYRTSLVKTRLNVSPVKRVSYVSSMRANSFHDVTAGRPYHTPSTVANTRGETSGAESARAINESAQLLKTDQDVELYVLQSKMRDAQQQINALQQTLREKEVEEESRRRRDEEKAAEAARKKRGMPSDLLQFEELGGMESYVQETPSTEFHAGHRTGVYASLWEHANRTKTFKYCELWEPSFQRHRYMKRTSAASPNHKIQVDLSTASDTKSSRSEDTNIFTLSDGPKFLKDLSVLKKVALWKTAHSKYGKAFVHLPAANKSAQRRATHRPLLTLMSPKLLIRMCIFLSDTDIYKLACCDKRTLLWTSCPVLWGAKASSLAQNIEPMLNLIHTTSEAYEDYKRVRSDLKLIAPAYIEDIWKLGQPERVVRDVVAICGLLLHPHTDPFSGIRTFMKPPVQVPLISWPACQNLLKQDFLKHVLGRDPMKLSKSAVKRSRPFLKHKHLAPEKIRVHSKTAATLAEWVHAAYKCTVRYHQLCAKGEKLLENWTAVKELNAEYRHRLNLWHRCEDGWIDGMWVW